MFRKSWMSASLMVLAAQAAQAQSDAGMRVAEATPREQFITLDADGDRTLSRSELMRHPELQRSFESMDRNRDGALSGFEYASAKNASVIRRELGKTR